MICGLIFRLDCPRVLPGPGNSGLGGGGETAQSYLVGRILNSLWRRLSTTKKLKRKRDLVSLNQNEVSVAKTAMSWSDETMSSYGEDGPTASCLTCYLISKTIQMAKLFIQDPDRLVKYRRKLE